MSATSSAGRILGVQLGGITQWMKIASMAEAFNLPIVSHLVPEIHVHLVAAVPNGVTLEYMPRALRLYYSWGWLAESSRRFGSGARTVDLTLLLTQSPDSARAAFGLYESGAPFTPTLVDTKADENKAPAYLAVNPMGKIPAITHGDVVVTDGQDKLQTGSKIEPRNSSPNNSPSGTPGGQSGGSSSTSGAASGTPSS